MEIAYKPRALEDIQFFKKTGNRAIQRKISKLLSEIELHPETGTGKPEKLKENLSGYWSRRINKDDRIVYTIDNERQLVDIYSLRGHYDRMKG
jgi:toxin YoeB